MCSIGLDESEIFPRMYQALRENNENQSELKNEIRHGVINTFKTLIHLYVKEFRKIQKMGFMADSDLLPALRTNRAELATLTGGCKRTMYEHIARLMKAELLDKQTHGIKKNFEVWVNPWILFGDSFPKPKLADLSKLTAAENQPISLNTGKTLPQISTKETLNNLLISGVDLSKTIVGEGIRRSPTNPRLFSITKDYFTKETGGGDQTVNVSETKDKAPGGGAATGPHIPVPADDNGWRRAGNGPDVTNLAPTGTVPLKKPVDPLLAKLQKTLTLSFWQLAKEKLYPEREHIPEYERETLRTIWRDIFFGWQHSDTRELSNELYISRVQQLEKVHRYIRKENWTSVLPPINYFSVKFYNAQTEKDQKGSFHYTTAWQIKDQEAREKRQHDNLLMVAVQSVLNEKAPKGVKNGSKLDRIEIYQYWTERLYRQTSGDTVIRFNQQVGSMFTTNNSLKISVSSL